ncbi:hypothetical protein Tco_0468642 [Tanacetum coccineum]
MSKTSSLDVSKNEAKKEAVYVVQIVLWVVDSGCSKHMTGDRSLLRNFVEKFMGTVRFGNDNFAAITGYGDYIHGNITSCASSRSYPVYLAEGLILERKTTKEETKRLISKAILQERGRMQAQISSQIQNAIDNAIPSLVDASVRSYMSGHILHVHPAQVQSSSVPEQQYQLYLAMKVDPLLQQQDIAIWLALQMKFEKTQVPQTACRSSAIRTRDQDDPHDDAHPEGENSAKRQKTSEYEAYVSGESSSGQVNVEEPGPSTSGNQEQDDEFDFWTDSYASDDDEIPTKQVTQDIMEEISLTIDEAKLKKMADEMLRQRYLLYLKKGNSGLEKIVLSLHKFPAIVFNDDDIEERTSRWVNKCIKKFNPYARYGVENWKNPHAKIFYIRRQKEPGRPKEEIYSNSKIVQVIKTFWELGHEHKFITEIVARRANDCIVSITEPDYKNLNKNDIEDMYLLIMNNKVPDYANTGLLWSLSVFIRSSVIWERVHDFQLGIESYQQKINLTAPIITFPGIEEYDVFSIVYKLVHGIIYTNRKKEKRVMRPSEIHKFCDATLRRTLEGLKSYYNDVKRYQLANKKCQFDVEVFCKALNICPRVQGKEFIIPVGILDLMRQIPPFEEELLTFLIGLGYKGELTHLPKMFIDHMHQPWRTLASIINKYLSGKTTSNDRLCQSRVAIIWGMFRRKNINFAELIWEDFSYQIDNKQLKKGRHEIMPYPRFTKIIINHFLSVHKVVPKGLPSGIHTIKDDGVLGQMKFFRIGEDIQEYGKAIPDTLMTDEIKQSEAYKAFIGYSTALVAPKKTRGKGSKGKQQKVTTKKKTVITIEDNIITDDPGVAFELGKSISKTDAEIADETRRAHETHARLVTEKAASEEESDPELANRLTRRRRPSGITFRDTSNVPKKKSCDRSQKLKGIEVMIEEEQLAADTMQAIKAIKQTLKSQTHAEGSSEGTGITPGDPDESTVIFTTSSKGTERGARDQDDDDDDDDDDKSIDIEKTDNEEETNDEFVHGDEYVHDDMDKEMKDAKVAKTGKDEKTEEVKDDQAKVDIPQIQSPFLLNVPVSVIPEQVILSTAPPPPPSVTNLTLVLQQQTTPIPAPPITNIAPTTTTIPDPLPSIAQRVSVLENDVQELKQVDHSAEILSSIRSQVPPAKDVSKICKIKNEQAEKQQMPKYSVKSSDKAALDEYDQKNALFQTMIESKSFNNHPAHKALYHTLMESLLADEEGMDQGVVDLLKQKKRQHDDQDEDHSARPNQCNSPPKTLKFDKSEHAKESVVKPTEEVNLDAAIENVVKSDDQPQDDSKPQTDSVPKHNWFKQPPRPPSPDPEWNMCQVIDDQPEQPWNRLKLDKITKADLVGPVYNLLKGTCQSSIELEYNMEECFKALTNRLD